jgi:hypothetical protein
MNNTLLLPLLLHLLLFPIFAFSQHLQKEMLAELGFMVGEWIGTSKGYSVSGELIREEPAFQSIEYDLDSTIIVIRLNSESLKLHTIIRYDEEDKTFYYYPFSSRGMRPAPAELANGKLIVNSTEAKRYIFGRTADGGFREYGEKLIDGEWVKYFQDDFVGKK